MLEVLLPMILALAPASHHDVLLVLVSFTILLVSARGLAELAGRFGQPPVVGEIAAGLLLGPSLLSGLVPALGSWIIPESAEAGYLLELLGMLGAMFLLILTGIETDIPLIKRNARVAVGVAAGGLFLPFSLGFTLAQFIPDDLLGDPSRREVFALFLATAMAVSAIPVVAKVLLDLGLIRRRFGQTVLAAGMIDDTVAWVMLSLVLALATGETGGLGTVLAAGRILLFLALSATLGRWLVNRMLAFVQDHGKSPDRIMTTVVATAFGFGAVAQALGIEAVLGAFVAGILLGQNPRLPPDVVRRLHTIALAIFAPVFFAIAGLKVDIAALAEPRLVALTALILGVAIVGKVVGAFTGAKLVGVDTWTAAAYGSALNARGAVEIIIASIGLSIGILSVELYSIVVLTAVVTSVMTPSLVRFFLSKVPDDPAERRELDRAQAEESGFGKPRRILIPVRPRSGVSQAHRVAADIVVRIGGNPSVTLLSVVPREQKAHAEWFLDEVAALFPAKPTQRVLLGDDPLTTILEVAAADHDFMMLGAHEPSPGDDSLFNPLVDAIARMAPCPTLMVTGPDASDSQWPPRRVLVPTDGTASARRAAQFGFAILSEADISVMHVVHRSPHARVDAPEPALANRFAQAQAIVDDTAELALAYDVAVKKEVVMSPVVAEKILEAARDTRVDAIVMGINLRPGSGRLHLGPQVESILQDAPCAVLLLNTP